MSGEAFRNAVGGLIEGPDGKYILEKKDDFK